jgi:hypothetical protein
MEDEQSYTAYGGQEEKVRDRKGPWSQYPLNKHVPNDLTSSH